MGKKSKTPVEKPMRSKENIEYHILSSAIYSCKIEGNSIDFETYLKNKKIKAKKK